MNIFTKLILISLLCAGILAQINQHTGSKAYYVQNGQTYQQIYGQGQQGTNSHGDRSGNSDNSILLDDQRIYALTKPTTTHTPIQVRIDCPHNQVYDNKLCICVCLIGYYYDGDSCVPNSRVDVKCKRNQIYRDGRCVCDKGFFLIGSICDVCPPYSTYELARTRCVCAQGFQLVSGQCRKFYNPSIVPVAPSPPVCSINERLLNNICICIEDFYFIKGQCTYCPAPNTYDPQLAICKPRCQLNEVLDINVVKCVCASGFNDINGNCGKCRPYSVYNKNTRTCDCVQGYVLNNFNCIPETHAPIKPTPLTPPAVICGNNQNFVGGQCICQRGYNLINGACVKCPTGTFYDGTLKLCRIPCKVNQVYNGLKKLCECAKDTFKVAGVCTKCPGDSKYDPKARLCACQPGYSLVSGKCIPGCGINQILLNGVCCCKTGYYPVGGICGICGWDQVYDQGLGICRIPCDQDRIYSVSQRRCVCLPHLHELSNGRCTTCPVNSAFDVDTKTCVCAEGFIKNLGLCISACNAYEQFVGGKCVCKTGYYLIGYTCGVCPPLQVYDSIYRICRVGCKHNEVWDTTIRACRCLPGFYLVQGVCSQCNPKTQVYDQKNQCCDCKSGYFKTAGQGCNGVCIPRCTDNEDWLGNRCACKPGFYLINNFCTKCPEGQIYDIYERVCRIQCGHNQVYNFNSGKCDCIKGFVIIQGTCSKCPEGLEYDEYKQQCRASCPINQQLSPITGLCVCQSRYVRIKGLCTNCAPGFYYDSYSDTCVCRPGFKPVNGFCQPICPLDQTYINGKCQCLQGELKNGRCIFNPRCPYNSKWDKSTQCCVCNPGFSMYKGQCTQYQYCGENGFLKYGKCYCRNGFYWILNRCQPCGLNEAYNGVVCQCMIGYIRDIYGTCVVSNFEPNCYDNQRYDRDLKACVCVDGTQFINSGCVKIKACGENSYFDGVDCACNTGYTKADGVCKVVAIRIPDCPTNAHFNGVSCICDAGFSRNDNNECSRCQAGQSWDGYSCVSSISSTSSTSQTSSTSSTSSGSSDQTSSQTTGNSCASGFIFNSVSNKCEPAAAQCGEHSTWNGALCICTEGAHQINGRCQVCAQGTTFDGAKCSDSKKITTTVSCGSNQIEVSGKCVCATNFHDFNGQCIKCPENTEWNGQFCYCKVSDVTKWCIGTPFTIFIGGSCPCQAGRTMVMGLCSAHK